MSQNLDALTRPISEEEVEWRVSRAGIRNDGEPWAIIVPYVQSRAVMARLDEAFTPLGWSSSIEPVFVGDSLNFLCTIAAEGSYKCDGAPATDIESFKGGISDAIKRAGVQWGIGRDLYKIRGTVWATFNKNGAHTAKIKDEFFRWDAPPLESILGVPSNNEASTSLPQPEPPPGSSPTSDDSRSQSPLLPKEESGKLASKYIDQIRDKRSLSALGGWMSATDGIRSTLSEDDQDRINGAIKEKKEELAGTV